MQMIMAYIKQNSKTDWEANLPLQSINETLQNNPLWILTHALLRALMILWLQYIGHALRISYSRNNDWLDSSHAARKLACLFIHLPEIFQGNLLWLYTSESKT